METVEPVGITKTEYRLHRLQVIGSIAHSCVRWGGASVIAFFGYRTVATLAGDATTADIGIMFLTDIRLNTVVSWLVGASGVIYGLKQEKLRKDDVERLTQRNSILETEIDPGRTSSTLTSRGETNPGDVI